MDDEEKQLQIKDIVSVFTEGGQDLTRDILAYMIDLEFKDHLPNQPSIPIHSCAKECKEEGHGPFVRRTLFPIQKLIKQLATDSKGFTQTFGGQKLVLRNRLLSTGSVVKMGQQTYTTLGKVRLFHRQLSCVPDGPEFYIGLFPHSINIRTDSGPFEFICVAEHLFDLWLFLHEVNKVTPSIDKLIMSKLTSVWLNKIPYDIWPTAISRIISMGDVAFMRLVYPLAIPRLKQSSMTFLFKKLCDNGSAEMINYMGTFGQFVGDLEVIFGAVWAYRHGLLTIPTQESFNAANKLWPLPVNDETKLIQILHTGSTPGDYDDCPSVHALQYLAEELKNDKWTIYYQPAALECGDADVLRLGVKCGYVWDKQVLIDNLARNAIHARKSAGVQRIIADKVFDEQIIRVLAKHAHIMNEYKKDGYADMQVFDELIMDHYGPCSSTEAVDKQYRAWASYGFLT